MKEKSGLVMRDTGIDWQSIQVTSYMLQLYEQHSAIARSITTLGFNVETVEYNGINFTTWDVSGRSGIVS